MFSEASQLLANDHHELDEVIEQLETALQTGDVEMSHAKLDLFWARLAVHIRAEHLHLFPGVVTALKKNETIAQNVTDLISATSLIDHLRQDHDFFMHELARAIALVRKVQKEADRYVVRAALERVGRVIKRVRKRLANHNEAEEAQIYCWLSQLLDAAELADLKSQISVELGKRPPRFSDTVWTE